MMKIIFSWSINVKEEQMKNTIPVQHIDDEDNL